MEAVKMPEKEAFLKGDIQITVKTVAVEGSGVILLTGPSSCGKGEIAKALRKFLSIPEERHLSMGAILRMTIQKAKEDEAFRERLAEIYHISHRISIFDSEANRPEVVLKAENHKNEVIKILGIKDGFISQLEWLEFCVEQGLLIPDEWTVSIIDALLEGSPHLQQNIFILDGYPRTVTAAEYLLKTLKRLQIPVIKVLHLSITKEEMKIRALARGRIDDTEESLERRYQFYIDKVQPCIDYLKCCLGVPMVALIDAHQPVYNVEGKLDVEKSIQEVTISVVQALGLPRFLMDVYGNQ